MWIPLLQSQGSTGTQRLSDEIHTAAIHMIQILYGVEQIRNGTEVSVDMVSRVGDIIFQHRHQHY